jgi:circadian clock protein KaiC
MYHPSEVELAETTRAVLAEATTVKPERFVIDSLSEFRLLAENSLRLRRQILGLKQHFSREKTTLLLIDDVGVGVRDMQLQSISQGTISLGRQTPEFGPIRRRLQVDKMRNRPFSEGYHDFVIRRGGLRVFPRLIAAEHKAGYRREPIRSGVPELDDLLGGGLAKGTSTLVIGAAGTGKSSLATQFAITAAKRGEHTTLYLFDETIATFLERSAGIGMDVEPMISAGRMSVRQIDPSELTPGEFARSVRDAVEDEKSQIIVIDSLNGYLNATPSEGFLTLHLHELLTYLGQLGATTLLLMTQHGMVGADVNVPVDASYLADSVILLRYFEAFGEVRQAISVIKKRTGKHERTIREMRIENGIVVGEPIRHFQGVLTGSPQFVGQTAGASKGSNERRGED